MSTRRAGLTVFLLFLLVFLGHSWEAELKLDAMTYAALAKNILRTGDWRTLHYTADAYADFYQHPPLVMWMQATVFRLLGMSDLIARILPALCGLGTVALTFAWARRLGGAWMGFAAGLILLSSARYVKYATDFFLDGPLALWLMLGGWLFLTSDDESSSASARGRGARAALAGVAGAAAILSKGMVGLAAPLAILTYCALPSGATDRWRRAAIAVVTCFALVGVWIVGFGGAEFIARYWAESVAYRVSGGVTWQSRLETWETLLRTWWPWLPFFAFGAVRAVPAVLRADAESRWIRMAMISAFAIPTAFTVTGHALDHYLVPFFPFAAVIAAWPLTRVPPLLQNRLHDGVRAVTIALAFALATLPVKLHWQRRPDFQRFLRELEADCPRAREFALHGSAGPHRWEALAQLAWLTTREARFFGHLDDAAGSAPRNRLIILARSEELPAGYEIERDDRHAGLAAISPRGADLCNP